MTYVLSAHAMRQMQVDCLSCLISPQVLLEFIPAFVLFPFELFCLNLPQDYTSIHGQGPQLSCYCTFSFYSQVRFRSSHAAWQDRNKTCYHGNREVDNLEVTGHLGAHSMGPFLQMQ